MTVHRKLKAYGGDFLPRNLWTAFRGRKSNPQKYSTPGRAYVGHQNLISFPRSQSCIGIAR